MEKLVQSRLWTEKYTRFLLRCTEQAPPMTDSTALVNYCGSTAGLLMLLEAGTKRGSVYQHTTGIAAEVAALDLGCVVIRRAILMDPSHT